MVASRQTNHPDAGAGSPARSTKKEQILSLYSAGITDVEELAILADSRPSHVASVLSGADKLSGYFDLYTSTGKSMNVYSRAFARRLGFRDEEIAQRSVRILDSSYRRYAVLGDRAGQHHALVMALTMFDRARWTGKAREADIFRRWLCERLTDSGSSTPSQEISATSVEKPR